MQTLERTLTSNEVAEMIGKEHSKLIRDIRTYEGYLAEAKIGSGDFFIESTYFDGNNQERPNYLLTKQGCEMVSNKLTGPKGVQFTARYVSRFNDMENHIKEQPINTDNLSPELQMFQGLFQSAAKQELEIKELKQANEKIETKVDNIKDIVALTTVDWRRDSQRLITKIAQTRDGGANYQAVRNEIYQETERRAKAKLGVRVKNKKSRMALEGVMKSKINAVNKLDVIGEDSKLLEIYIAVVKDFAIKHGVELEQVS